MIDLLKRLFFPSDTERRLRSYPAPRKTLENFPYGASGTDRFTPKVPRLTEEELRVEIMKRCASNDAHEVIRGAGSIGTLLPHHREQAIRMVLNLEEDWGCTPIEFDVRQAETINRAQNHAIQCIGFLHDMDRRFELVKDIFEHVLLSHHALTLLGRLWRNLEQPDDLAERRTYQHKLMRFLVNEDHLNRTNGEDAIVAAVLLLDKVRDDDLQEELLEKILASSKIRDCLIREQRYQRGLIKTLEEMAEDLDVEIPDAWRYMTCHAMEKDSE